MEENKNFEEGNKVPGVNNEKVEQLHEQQVEQTIAQIESKMTGLSGLEKEVGGDQGIKDTVSKMTSEEKQRVSDRIKGVVESHMKGVKTGAILLGGMALAVTLEYFGIKSLDTSSWENLGKGLPEWYQMSGIGLMGLTSMPGIAGFGIAATKGIQALKERVKLFNFERKNKE